MISGISELATKPAKEHCQLLTSHIHARLLADVIRAVHCSCAAALSYTRNPLCCARMAIDRRNRSGVSFFPGNGEHLLFSIDRELDGVTTFHDDAPG
jgi:hypothetical protein